MGLKTANYEVENFGITLPTAYARLVNVDIDIDGKAIGKFEIHQTREDIENHKSPFNVIYTDYTINKEKPIYKQIYEKAKIEYFSNWEDDIVEE